MEKSDWGERGDFRKLTVTLPPDVYDALVQESARRKSARDPNHLLSAIAREWFVQRQPLLPIEKTELGVYRAADAQRPWFILQSIYEFAQRLGEPNTDILVDLLVDMQSRGWLYLEKYSEDAKRYLPFAHWRDNAKFFYEGSAIRLQVTIPRPPTKRSTPSKTHSSTMISPHHLA